MPEDTLRVTIDPSNSFDVLQRLGGGFDRLGSSGDRIGAGFLRGDRVIRTATANITRSLLSVQSSGDAAGVALEGLERVFNIGVGATIGLAAGIAAFVLLKREADAADESVRTLSSDLASTSLAAGPEAIATSIKKLSTEVQDATQKLRSPGGRLAGFLDEFVNPLLGTSSRKLDASQTSAIKAGIVEIIQLSKAQADVQDRLNEINRAAISGIGPEQQKQAERQAEFDKAELTLSEKIAAIDQAKIKGKLDLFEATKKGILKSGERDDLIRAQDKLAEREKDSAFVEARITLEKQKQVNLTKDLADAESKRLRGLHQQQDTAKQAQDFFTDLGSGKFAKDFDEKQKRDFQTQAGKDLAKQIEEGQSKGFFKDPLSQAALKEAQRISDRAGTSVTDLANTDFANLLELSKYDFSGLQPLSGLTLRIQ